MPDSRSPLTWLLCFPRKTTFLLLIAVGGTFVVSGIAYLLLKNTADAYVPSTGNISASGVEVFWDRNLIDRTEAINWGTIWPGSLKNVTLYIRSFSNDEATLVIESTNWNPVDMSEYMKLSWDYNGTVIHPGGVIEVALTLSVSSSEQFIEYIRANDVRHFSFDIIISTQEHSS